MPVDRHLVVVPVGELTRALLHAIDAARALGTPDVRGLHIVQSDESAHTLGVRWMELGLEIVPLDLVEAPQQPIAAAVTDTVIAHLGCRESVSVLLPQIVVGWPWQALHNQTGRRIARALRGLPGVTVRRVPFIVPPAHTSEP